MWIKNGKIFCNPLVIEREIDGKAVKFYRHYADLSAANTELPKYGYSWSEPEPPEPPAPDPRDWRSKESFIAAVKKLLPAEKLAQIMSDPAKLREAIAGIALLATDAAPGGMIDVADPRVAEFLSLSGLTVEQVIAEMNK